MKANRRDFLVNAGLAATAAAMGGCAAVLKTAPGGAMTGYAAPRLGKVRVGVVGIGSRGNYAVHRLCTMPGVEVAALCDLKAERAQEARQWMKERNFGEAKTFTGPEGYKRLCESGLCDVVHNNTDWSGHVPVCLYAMSCGLHVCVEVPGCRTVEEGWRLVEASEKHRRHCIMLENCCYGRNELLLLNLARTGVLGTIMHGEGGYIHDGRWIVRGGNGGSIPWRLKAKQHSTGSAYPTHGLGPVALAMNVNRGDRFDYLVSLGSVGFGYQDYARRKYGADSFLARMPIEYNDMNTTLIRTVKGKSIMLQQYGSGPHPYSRMNKLVGTDGVAGTYPLRVALEKTLGAEVKEWMDAKELKEFGKKHEHPLWRKAGDIARVSGGHGGMDFLMDLRWVYCLQQGLPVDMDVYDLASWSSLVELTQTSVRSRGRTMDVPDFTRGGWSSAPAAGDMDIDFDKVHLDVDKVRLTGRQQNV